MNLGTFLDNTADKYADAPILRFYDQTITYADFARQVNKLADSLKKTGFHKGDFIHVLVQNSPETLVSYCAIQKIGAVAGPVNGWWKGKEIQYLFNDSKAPGLIIEDQYLPVFEGIRDQCPYLKTVIVKGDGPGKGYLSFSDLMEQGDPSPITCLCDENDTAYIFYTSGTTGDPKGVLLSHKNVLADVDAAVRGLKLKERQTVLTFLPLFHVEAMVTCTFSMGMGHTIVLRRSFSAREFWQVVEDYKVNFWSAVPAVYQILLTDPGAKKHDLSSLQFGVCGAAPLTPETFHRFQDTFNIPIVEGYGLTETTCVCCINPVEGERKVGSIGLPLPGVTVRILDDRGNEQPTGAAGEICVQGDVVMKGYHNRPRETAQAVINGFLHTGDVGYMDEDGYIFIVDRKKDVIIRGGENIYPNEIDNFLATHPKIQEAAAIGVPDPIMGEEVKVYVLPLDDGLTGEDVIRFCKENLAGFKVPKHVQIMDGDFPRSPIGKVLKKELRQWAIHGQPEKKKLPRVTVEDIFNTMESRVKPERIMGVDADYGYVVTGSGGGQWTVGVHDGTVRVKQGLSNPMVVTTLSARDWIAITLGKLDPVTAFSSGRLKVEGDMGLLVRAAGFFKKYTPPASEN